MSAIAFADIEVGAVLPERSYPIDAADVSAYREALGLDADSLDVPSTYCVMLLREIRTLLPAPPGGIHAGQSFEFMQPMRIGDSITVRSQVVQKEVRRDRNHVVIETTFTRSDGTLLVRGTARRIWAR